MDPQNNPIVLTVKVTVVGVALAVHVVIIITQ